MITVYIAVTIDGEYVISTEKPRWTKDWTEREVPEYVLTNYLWVMKEYDATQSELGDLYDGSHRY